MPGKLEFRGFELTGNLETLPATARRLEGGAVRIGVIADLRTRGEPGSARSEPALATRRITRVDRDNIDQVLGRLGVELSLTLPGEDATPIALTFREIEDFHPDRILARADVFATLRSTRARLQDPATFAATADQLPASLLPAVTHEPDPPQPQSRGAPAAPESLLDLILRQSSSSPTPGGAGRSPSPTLGPFLERITAPYIRHELPHQAELIAGVDSAITHLLRGILHHPRFQALESLWRAIDLLTRRLETGTALSIELIDATRAELEADLLSAKPIDSLDACKLLVDESIGTQGGQPWTFLVADLTFDPNARDIALLWRLGQLARLVGAPLFAAASPRFVGCESLAASPDPDTWGGPDVDDSWSDLRRSDEAPYLGLALPRFLLRAPYGQQSVPIEAFAFEELTGHPPHDFYLWGNPAFALAVLLGSSFDAGGRFDQRRLDCDLSDLPLPLELDADGETREKPCAEVLLGHRAAERMLDAGLMPFQSIRDRDAIHLAGLVSVADPPVPLALR
jgi:type VI secretion system protein ImpC